MNLLPASNERIRENAALLLADLEALDRELVETGELMGEKLLLGSHPVYQYLARRCGLNIPELSWDANPFPARRICSSWMSWSFAHAQIVPPVKTG